MGNEGFSSEHDDLHIRGELAAAAVCYASPEQLFVKTQDLEAMFFEDPWPESWESQWDKRNYEGTAMIQNGSLPLDQRIRNLVKAGALIAAEIDRLQRRKNRNGS